MTTQTYIIVHARGIQWVGEADSIEAAMAAMYQDAGWRMDDSDEAVHEVFDVYRAKSLEEVEDLDADDWGELENHEYVGIYNERGQRQ